MEKIWGRKNDKQQPGIQNKVIEVQLETIENKKGSEQKNKSKIREGNFLRQRISGSKEDKEGISRKSIKENK